jgi:hypothetical protein
MLLLVWVSEFANKNILAHPSDNLRKISRKKKPNQKVDTGSRQQKRKRKPPHKGEGFPIVGGTIFSCWAGMLSECGVACS